MANSVFANGREIACKAGAGKSIAAFPDVCLSPPSPPAGPLPLPYPVTAMASDTTKGSKKVKISKKEVILKNKSCMKKCNGDQAATKSFGMGVVTHALSGKVYFSAWSMDVKYEGKNVTRHFDITTHNHNSMPGDTPPWPYVDTANMSDDDPCKESVEKEQTACKGVKDHSKKGKDCSSNKGCAEARACALPKKKDASKVCCNPDTTGDHLIEVNCFTRTGGRDGVTVSVADMAARGITYTPAEGRSKTDRNSMSDFENYDDEEAPTCCTSATEGSTTHGAMQAARDVMKRGCRMRHNGISLGGEEISFWNYKEASAVGAKSHKIVHDQCDEKCTKAQLDKYHKEKAGINDGDDLRTDIPAPNNAKLTPRNPSEQYLADHGMWGKVKTAFRQALHGKLG